MSLAALSDLAASRGRTAAFEALAAVASVRAGRLVALRLLRIGLRKLTWRLRNRLIVAYLFIAVLPILLVLTLVGAGRVHAGGTGGGLSGAIGIGPAAGFASIRGRGCERVSVRTSSESTKRSSNVFLG